MREIKFRAWDHEFKRWYEPVFEAYRGELWELIVSFEGRLSARTLDKNGTDICLDESMFPNRYTLVQFTGVKDKNGEEIYEGDVIRQGFPDTPLGEVRFEDGQFGITYLKRGGTWGFCSIAHFGGGTNEIIGNIYENPDLLK